MTVQRLLLYTLTALAGIGALYFWAVHVAMIAAGILVVVLVCVGLVYMFRRRQR